MKKFIIGIIGLLVIGIGSYFFIQDEPPLVTSQMGGADYEDVDVRLINIGNESSSGEISIQEVLVNDREEPTDVMIQVSDHEKGVVTSNTWEEEMEYKFEEIEDVSLETNTELEIPEDNEKSKPIYALTLKHTMKINQAIIKYEHLGEIYEKVVSIQ
ncbi:hypothetical protein CEY16_13380 [Halalkalibacillus sediminis]|uniref:DUF4352 domain-containing protein n=1 Tax=Halalkalibacillus sediminis TaxID=2018042 RepID=A0A2I0QR48_9BACI|nr:hypothetical protein [Halalkalibacillus sediminis]PKR76803.1 hypothetical protein CEY16_13380 [Halalkalibacillus sediminis]